MAEANATDKPKQGMTSTPEEGRKDVASTGTSTGAAARAMAERNRHPLLTLRDEFDRLFDEASSMFRFPWNRRSPFDLEPLLRSDMERMAFAPPAEVEEREGEYRVTMEMPGMDEQSVDISVQDDVLSIRAEKREETEEKGGNRYFSERRYGVCARSFRLPANVDQDRIAATMKNGLLTVTLPKAETSRRSGKKIEIGKA
ncbi:Hsp20/alpha crystallin family protein [Azospirillum rugosum]|uniref:HSP20 family protein n=1 Tax=Azospirillum rugosum TaxID=416170 RepID=A0ABS4SDK4_9PROT|nr:Hsp20/alpha crystallin family protein [Azospirillum rugosum]MBP2290653.1 HSP20 family protein [Azospirillum rugosum]MDQ0525541.1 HSP20 family protein [Azospirillum rugosum]